MTAFLSSSEICVCSFFHLCVFFLWLGLWRAGRGVRWECHRKKVWTWKEMSSSLSTSLCSTKNISTACLLSASLPTLYCITRANFLFSLRTVLVSIYRTRYNYAHNDFCTQCDFISLRGARETGGSLLLPMGQGEGMWCWGGFSYWGSSSKMFNCSVWSHGVFRLAFLCWPSHFPASLFFTVVESSQQQLQLQEALGKCGLTLSQELRSHIGWFAIFSAWEIKVWSLF